MAFAARKIGLGQVCNSVMYILQITREYTNTLDMVDLFFFFLNPYQKFMVAQNCIKKDL